MSPELLPTAGGPDVLPNPIPEPDPEPPQADPTPEPSPVPPVPEPAPAFSATLFPPWRKPFQKAADEFPSGAFWFPQQETHRRLTHFLGNPDFQYLE